MSKGKNSKRIGKDTYETPNSFFEMFGNGCTCDVAASAGNAKCDDYIDEEMNALETEWAAVNWCNPPFSKKSEFIDCAMEQQVNDNKKTIMLLPASTGAKWFMQVSRHFERYGGQILFIGGRITFRNGYAWSKKDEVWRLSAADFDVVVLHFDNKFRFSWRSVFVDVPKEHRSDPDIPKVLTAAEYAERFKI